MGMIQQEGTFMAYVEASGVSEIESGYCVFDARYVIPAEHNPGLDQDYSISGKQFLFKPNGEMYTKAVQNLRRVFEWDGMDLAKLDSPNLDGKWCKIVVIKEDGYLNVKWVNHYADEHTPRDVQQNGRSLAAKYGPLLRAAAGGAPAPAPAAPPPPAPKTSPSGEVSQPPQASAPPRQSQRQEFDRNTAWAAFTAELDKINGSVVPTDEAGKHWNRVLDENFPGVRDEDMTADNWQFMATQGAKMALDDVPFGN